MAIAPTPNKRLALTKPVAKVPFAFLATLDSTQSPNRPSLSSMSIHSPRYAPIAIDAMRINGSSTPIDPWTPSKMIHNPNPFIKVEEILSEMP